MAEDEDRPHKSRRAALTGALFPWRKFKNLDPRKRIPKQRLSWRDAGSSFSFALSALKRRSSTCPECEAPRSLTLLEAVNSAGGDVTYVLGCQHCDYLENVEMKLEAVTKKIDDLRIGERRFLIGAACAAGFGFLYYFMTGYLFTLIGAMLIATMILTNAILFRYRVWQLVHQRLYEDKAPLADWLRHEFS